jgi:hypothetical protein
VIVSFTFSFASDDFLSVLQEKIKIDSAKSVSIDLLIDCFI